MLLAVWKDSINGAFVGIFLAVMGAFLSALIQLARYIKDKPIITENGSNSSSDNQKDVAEHSVTD